MIQLVNLPVWNPDCKAEGGTVMHTLIENALISLFLIMQSPQIYLPRPNYLASGDPVAGRRVYLTLKCNTCHTIAGEPIGVRPPRLPGPQLGKSLALQSPQEIADSIAAPGHQISEESGPWRRSRNSNMGDYTNIMTVRQFIDLVAYLRSL